MTIDRPLDVFLLLGQSNMSGRGSLGMVPPIDDPYILVYRPENGWTRAREPLHDDDPQKVGVGLGMSFARKRRVRVPERAIGLVPCAVGGSPLRRWSPGADLFERALTLGRQAAASGVVRGILWHQGETDADCRECAISYSVRLRRTIDAFREGLGLPSLPFITGELGTFLSRHDRFEHYDFINIQLSTLADHTDHYACVSSEGLNDDGDALHFDAASLRIFGQRYEQAYAELTASHEMAALA
jgi:hypothetical protein